MLRFTVQARDEDGLEFHVFDLSAVTAHRLAESLSLMWDEVVVRRDGAPLTVDDALGWLEYEGEQQGRLSDDERVMVGEARRVVAQASGAPWWEVEGVGPDRGRDDGEA